MKRVRESVRFEMPGPAARFGATGKRFGETVTFEMVGAVTSGGGGGGAMSR